MQPLGAGARFHPMATALLVAAALAAGAPAPDPPGIVLERVAAPTHVAARDGTAVFGAFDPATGTTTLMRRGRDGSIAPAGLPPIPAPAFAGDRRGRRPGDPPAFEVTLGTGPGGSLVAAYMRCPVPARRTSCRLALADLATGIERLVPGTGRALRGAVSGSRVVVVRRDTDGIQRLYTTARGSSELRRLRLPRPDSTFGDGAPIDRRRVQIAAVDVRGDDVAYVVNYPLSSGGELSSSDIWLNRGGRAPRLVARVRTGGASSGFREYLQPRLYASSIVAFQQARDQGNGVQRWSLRGRLLGAGSIGLQRASDHEITGGTFDRARFLFATNPYQGNGCAGFDEPAAGATCPVLDSGPVVLRPPPR
jgi:hypothetical protein